jgi:uncharacterized protein with FMN-binding domain
MNFLPKRGVIGGALTVAALALVLSFKTPENLPVTTGASGSADGTGGSPVVAQQSASTGGNTSGSKSGQVTGQAVSTPFGNVQLQVTLQNGQITDIQALQMPNADRRSAEISSYAAPQLRSEALAAQSARIDTVSGATYTSLAYIQSLQSALDQAA